MEFRKLTVGPSTPAAPGWPPGPVIPWAPGGPC